MLPWIFFFLKKKDGEGVGEDGGGGRGETGGGLVGRWVAEGEAGGDASSRERSCDCSRGAEQSGAADRRVPDLGGEEGGGKQQERKDEGKREEDEKKMGELVEVAGGR